MSMLARRTSALVLALLAVAPGLADLAPAAASEGGTPAETRPLKAGVADAPCLSPAAVVDGLGRACPVSSGWKVFLDSGLSVLTHGFDPAPGHDAAGHASGAESGREPGACAEDDQVSRVVLVYASPGSGNYLGMRDSVRADFERLNGHLAREARTFGVEMSLRVACDPDGHPAVAYAGNVPSSFGALTNELHKRGFSKSNEKYLIFYDGSCGCGAAGIGTFVDDDRPGPDNPNNRGPDYAVSYGYGWTVLMHELGHTLGAVQSTSPNTSGAAHCNDGLDIMCYADGGPKSFYTSTACSSHEWDCNNDDYFNPRPGSGTYLARAWNLAAPWNAFLDFCGAGRDPQRDLAVCGFDAPRWAKPNATAEAVARVRNHGAATETAVVTLSWGDEVKNATTLTLAPDESLEVRFLVETGAVEDERDLVVRVAAQDGTTDEAAWNDARDRVFRVIQPEDELLVAVVDSPGTDAPGFGWSAYDEWWNFGRTAVTVDVDSLDKPDVTVEDLRAVGADVVALTDLFGYGWIPTTDELEAIEQYVSEGHGVIGTNKTLEFNNKNPPTRLFGVTGAETARSCPSPVGPRDLAFLVADPVLTDRLANPHRTTSGCGLSPPLNASHATLAAESEDQTFRLFSYRHADSGLGAGAAVYATFGPFETPADPGNGDLQLGLNMARWAARESAQVEVDRGVIGVRAPAIVCAGHPFQARALVRNYGWGASPDTTARLLVDDVEVASWSLGDLGGTVDGRVAQASLSWPVTLAEPLGWHRIAFEVDGPGETLLGNNWRDAGVTLQACAPPSPPRDLTAWATGAPGEVHLRWTRPASDGGTRVTHFVVSRAEEGGAPVEIARIPDTWGLLQKPTFTDAGLVPGVSYAYQVAAEHGGGVGAWSHQAHVEMPEGTPLEAPRDVRLTQGDGTLRLSWRPPANAGGAPISGYRVYRGPSPDALADWTTVSGTDVTDARVNLGETWHYAVAAVATDEGPRSATVSGLVVLTRASGALAASGDRAYLLGGWDGAASDAISSLDVVTGHATPLAARLPAGLYSMPGVFDPRPTAACPEGCAYVFGGFHGDGTRSGKILRFDPAGLAVEQVGTLPTPRVRATAVWDPERGVAWLFGGHDGQTLADVLVFDPLLGTLLHAGSLPEKRLAAAGVWHDGAIYLLGGAAQSLLPGGSGGTVAPMPSRDVLRFDPATRLTTRMEAQLPWPLDRPAAATDGRHVYLYGGISAGGSPLLEVTGAPADVHDEILRYDPATDTLVDTGLRLPTPRHDATAFAGPDARWVVAGCALPRCEARADVSYRHEVTPVAPGNVRVQSLDGTNATLVLAWDPPSNVSYNEITSYRVYRGASPALLELVGETTESSFHDALPHRGSHFYRVAAVNEGRTEGAASPALEVFLAPLPEPPAVTATAGPGLGQVTLAWTPPPDDGRPKPTAYRVYRGGPEGDLAPVAQVAGTTFLDAGLGDGAELRYAVASVSAAGEGAASAPVPVRTFLATTPSAPRDLQAQPARGHVVVSWLPPEDEGDPALYRYVTERLATTWQAGARVDVAADGNLLANPGFEAGIGDGWGFAGCLPTVSTSWAAEGRQSARIQGDTTCAIMQSRASGEGVRSVADVVVRVESGAAKAGIEWLNAWGASLGGTFQTLEGPQTTRVTVSGEAPAQAKLARIVVRVASGAGTVLVDDASLRVDAGPGRIAFVDPGVESAVQYAYVVKGDGLAGRGAPANLTVDMPRFGTPGPTLNVTARVGTYAGTIDVSWSPPADAGDSALSHYYVYRHDGKGETYMTWVPADRRSVTLSGHEGGKTYWFSVRAANAQGKGAFSSEAEVVAISRPGAPTDLAACSAEGVVHLAWQPPSDDGGLPLQKYHVQRRIPAATPFVEVGTTTHPTTAFTDAGVTPGVAYEYRVLVDNGRFWSFASATAGVIAVPAGAPGSC